MEALTNREVAAIAAEFEFSPEMGGGGCTILSRHFNNGWFAWITCCDGGGLPEPWDWHVCAYPGALDASLTLRSDQDRLSLRQAVAAAVAAAGAASSETTEALTDEYVAWLPDALEQMVTCGMTDAAERPADELLTEVITFTKGDRLHQLEPLRHWLATYWGRWEAAQSREDLESAIAARGER